MAQANHRSRLEWLREADRYLAPDVVADLKSRVVADLKTQHDEARAKAELLERELAELGGIPNGAKPSEERAPSVADGVQLLIPQSASRGFDRNDPLRGATLKVLVLHFCKKAPGSSAGPIFEFIRRYKPAMKKDLLHGELYRLCKEGVLRKEGVKPNTCYFLVDEEETP